MFIIEILSELNLLGGKGEENKPTTVGLKPRVSDWSCHINH